MTGRNSADVDQLRREVMELRRLIARGASIRGDYDIGTSPGRVAGTAMTHDTLTELAEIKFLRDPAAWAAGTVYVANVPVNHNAVNYVCILGHTAVAGGAANEPGVGANWPTYWRATWTAYEVYVLEPQVGTRMRTLWPVWIDDSLCGDLSATGYHGHVTMSRWGNWYMLPPNGMDGALCTAWIDNNQVINNNAWTKLLLNQVMYNYGGHFSVVNNRFDVPQAGVYQFNCAVNFINNGNWNAGDSVGVFLYVNGAAVPGTWANQNQQSSHKAALLCRDLELAAGDFVEVYVLQASGAPCAVNGAPANSDRGMWLSISKLAKGGGSSGTVIREEDWLWFSQEYEKLLPGVTARMEPGINPSSGGMTGLPYDYYDMRPCMVTSIRAQHHLTPTAGAADFQVGRWDVVAAAYVWEPLTLTIAAAAVNARRDDLAFPIASGDRLAFRTVCNGAYIQPGAMDYIFAGAKIVGTL